MPKNGTKINRKVVLPAFSLSEVCGDEAAAALKRKIPAGNNRTEVTYSFRYVANEVEEPPTYNPTSTRYKYNLFPVPVNKDGVPWDVAVIYILSRLQGQLSPNMTTYHGIAEDLGAFLQFSEEYGIDYLDFPQNKLKRPTYRFRGYLKNLIFDGQLAVSTAKRRMAAVIAFYRWLVTEKLLSPANPLWQEKDYYLSVKDARGFPFQVTVKSTDVSIKTPKQNDPHEETIHDGGKLRPLLIEEQKWLIEALSSHGNTEMSLIHAFMLATGARIQTVLTLRVRHVQLEVQDGAQEIRLPVGPGTGVDTKNNKRMTLHIPIWLYEKLRIYSLSDRAKKRREKTAGGHNQNQYLFLTQQGQPYYQSRKETLSFDSNMKVRHQKKAQTVRVFITEHVIPYVQKKYNPAFRYRIHDMRATYGMNLTDIQLSLVERKETTLARAREFVKTRMGHESWVTTDLYLNYRSNLSMINAAVDAHEQYYRELIEKAWEGNLDVS